MFEFVPINLNYVILTLFFLFISLQNLITSSKNELIVLIVVIIFVGIGLYLYFEKYVKANNDKRDLISNIRKKKTTKRNYADVLLEHDLTLQNCIINVDSYKNLDITSVKECIDNIERFLILYGDMFFDVNSADVQELKQLRKFILETVEGLCNVKPALLNDSKFVNTFDDLSSCLFRYIMIIVNKFDLDYERLPLASNFSKEDNLRY